jgi:hypothetical protein
VDTQAIEARFGVMANGRVAEVNAAAVHAVLALNEARSHLVNARVVAVPLPSERWNRLLSQFGSKAEAPEAASAGPLSEVEIGERADRFARDLFVAAAAFLAAEANDLDDRISLLASDHRQEEIRVRLDDIGVEVGDTADALIGRVEDGTWQSFSANVPSGSGASPLDPSPQDKTRQSTCSRHLPSVGRTAAWSAAAGSAGVVITIFAENLRRNAPQSMVILVVTILLVCLGLLLGASWTTQALQPKLRHQAEERRRLNEEWQAIRDARRQRDECPRCASPLSERDWRFAPAVVEERPYDDDLDVIG